MAIAGLIVFILLLIGVAASSRSPNTNVQYVTMTATQTTVGDSPPQLIEYCFSPGGNCAGTVIKWINRANSTIHILIYSFTLDDVGDALVIAKQKNPGLDIKIVWDEGNWNATGSEYAKLKNAGIDIRVDYRNGLLHDKVAIIDDHIIITGSFNWSVDANTSNRDNLVVIDNGDWAAAYEQVFQRIWSASKYP